MLRDFRIAVRTLRSWRLGSVAAVLTLAIGIGTTTSLYALVQLLLASSSTHIEDVERMGRVYASNAAARVDRAPIPLAAFEAVLSKAQSFESIAAWTRADMTVGSGQDGEMVSVTSVSPDYFRVLRARPAAGRLFTREDFDNEAPVALVSEALWRGRLAKGSLADGVDITLNGIERRVVGVVPAKYDFPFIGIGGDAWVPMSGSDARAAGPVSVIGRLKPERSWGTAAAELSALAPGIERDPTWRWNAIPVQQDSRFRTVSGTTATLMPAVVVLIIGCVNVACMLLARGIERDTELGVRAALGASRGTIFRQLLIEHLVLASLGGIAGAAVAMGLMRLVASSVFAAVKPSIATELAGDPGLLPVAVVSTALACLLFGTIPALRLSRRDVSASLKGVASPSRVRVAGYGGRDLVVFVELGLAVMLVVLTAMYLSIFSALRQTTVPFAADELIAVPVAASDLAVASERVSAVPGVERIAVASAMPGGPRSLSARLRARAGRVATGDVTSADGSYFVTIGLPIVRGRGFDRAEAAANAPVAVVSESAARLLWPDAEAIGQVLEVSARGAAAQVTVVGVSRDAVDRPVLGLQPGTYGRSRWPSAVAVYRPLDVVGSGESALLVRTRHARALRRPVAAAARRSAAVPMPRAVVAGEQIRFVPPEATGIVRLFGGFALVALLLAGSGIFGVISQSVAQRSTEFGVRMALGATRGRVLRMVLKREGKLIAAALFAGSVGTVALATTVFAELVWISAMRPAWPAILIGSCGAVAAVACAFATYRIVRLDPWVVLRRL
jgi:predicted permease